MRSSTPALDTLIIPGGKGLRVPQTQRTVADWVGECAARNRRIATVCTGIYGLAATGLLNGRRVTTHWRDAHDLARRYRSQNEKAMLLSQMMLFKPSEILASQLQNVVDFRPAVRFSYPKALGPMK